MADGSVFVLGSFVVACSANVVRLPLPGESLRAEQVIIEAGGKGFNLAIGLSRLGVQVHGIVAVGDDDLAAFAPAALAKAGLDDMVLARYPGRTGSGVGFTDSAGETCLAVDPGANEHLSSADIRALRPHIAASAITLAQFEIADAPIVEAFMLAQDAGRRTLLNPSPFRTISPAILAATSILIVNAVEAANLADAIVPEIGPVPGDEPIAWSEKLGQALFPHGPDTLIVTLGAAGAVAVRPGQPALHQQAFAVPVRDTLGAGDAFAAGFVASLVAGGDLPTALRQAAACGGLAAQRPGVFHALPGTKELKLFLGTGM